MATCRGEVAGEVAVANKSIKRRMRRSRLEQADSVTRSVCIFPPAASQWLVMKRERYKKTDLCRLSDLSPVHSRKLE